MLSAMDSEEEAQNSDDPKVFHYPLSILALRLRVSAVKLTCGNNPAAAFAKADAAETFAFAESAHDDFVAVF